MGNIGQTITTNEGSIRRQPLPKTKIDALVRRHGRKDSVDLLRVMIKEEFPDRIAVVTSFSKGQGGNGFGELGKPGKPGTESAGSQILQ